MEDFIEKMNDATACIIDMTTDCVSQYDDPFEEFFPAYAYRAVKVNGKTYQMKMKVSIKLIEEED